MVIASHRGRRVAYVADEDLRAIVTVDLDTKEELATTFVGGVPAQMLILPDGRLAVAMSDAAQVLLFERQAASMALRPSDVFFETASEPRGMALSADRSILWVVTGFGHTLSGFRIADRSRRVEVELPREPRAVMASDDGKTLFVSHAVGGRMSVVELGGPEPQVRSVTLRARPRALVREVAIAKGDVAPEDTSEPPRVRSGEMTPEERKMEKARIAKLEKRIAQGFPTCQHFALAKATDGRVFLPGVSVDPGDLAEPPPAETYGSAQSESEVDGIAVIDPTTRAPSPASLERTEGPATRSQLPCLLPRAAAFDPTSKAVLVACQGTNLLAAYDGDAMSPVERPRGTWRVGVGPTGIAVDAAKREAVVWSQYDRTLAIVKLDDMPPAAPMHSVEDAVSPAEKPPKPVARIALSPAPRGGEAVALGRRLFHSSVDPRIAIDGRACASCHPDGRDDGLTWATPEGPRRTISLVGRLDVSAPYSWQGTAPTVRDHVKTTFKRLRGMGLEPIELDALVAYVKALPVPGHKGRPNQEQIDEGERLFRSARTGCGSCHSGGALTDGKPHDVGSGRAFDTPSLLGVGARGPYFHDGRYPDLKTLLRETDGKMGRTKGLTEKEMAALEAFLAAQ